MADMLDEIIARARKHRPNLLVSLNGGPESFPDDIMQRVSYIYAEPLDCPTGIALGSILMRGWGRPYFQAGDFYRVRLFRHLPWRSREGAGGRADRSECAKLFCGECAGCKWS